MELPSSSSESKRLQYKIFKQFAKYSEQDKQFVLNYDDFIKLLTYDQVKHTSIPSTSFGLIFLTVDEGNKGYLTVSDWFKFNNIINTNKNYHYILVYEFLRKINHKSNDKLLAINYNEKFMDFNKLFLKKDDLLNALKEIQIFTNSEFKIDWQKFGSYIDLYTQDDGQLSLASFITILQNDWVEYKVNQSWEIKSNGHSKNISNDDFFTIIDNIYGHKISPIFLNSLREKFKQSHELINYGLYKDVNYLIQNFDLLNQLFIRYYRLMRSLNLTTKSINPDDSTNSVTITKIEFINFINMQSSVTFNKLNNLTTFSSNQINLLFQLANKNNNNNNSSITPSIHDFLNILNPNNIPSQLNNDQTSLQMLQNPNFVFFPIFDSLYNFTLGSIAGAIGATIVYPIDLIKTRMQAQRGTGFYKNSLDCLYKVVHFNGIRGLYSGMTPQLIGVAPEKAIKLTVNDLVRNTFTNKVTKEIPLSSEILAGASAGCCQVIFTNPLEIVKIRLQIGGYGTAFSIIKSLGLKGLYKGVSACLLRDVPFSAIYFPTYAHIKKDIFNYDPTDKNKRKKLKTWELLVSGGLAGMPAAFLTTPCDVIKTRLQVKPQKGETQYRGIFHAFKTIVLEESWRSLFKGGAARVLRSSPQFGFTLAAYEIFQGLFPLPYGDGLKNIEKPTLTNKSNILKNDNNNEIVVINPDKKVWFNHYNYKSTEISKKFIEIDWNFKSFDYDVYKRFYEELKKKRND